ncbi:MAG: M56 family metallopeptidase [Oscillospiraceae bacterium]|nr:M56 family metallopeptidase [Oscillospiraceae bacterium]
MFETLCIFFNAALNKAIKTVPLILAILLLRLVMKRLPKKAHVWLWGVAALGLLLPTVHLPSKFSLVPRAEPVPHSIVYEYEPQVDLGVSPVDSSVNSVLTHFNTDGADSITPLMSAEYIASMIWACGILLIALYAAVSTVRLRLRLRTAKQDATEKRVYMSNACPTPFILGVFAPRIYLPENLPDADRNAVLLHERAHIRRGDHIWKLLGFAIAAVYWFDPLVWLGYHLFSKDVEFACDERVISKMDPAGKKAYAEALLHCSLLKLPRAACPLAFGETSVKARIASVAKFKAPAVWKLLLAAVSLPVTGICFLTDPIPPHYMPPQEVFEREILEHSRVTGSNINVCAYQILDKYYNPKLASRKVGSYYVAILLREYKKQDGILTLVQETFAPVQMQFKDDWLTGYDDLNLVKTAPRYESRRDEIMQRFHADFPDADPEGGDWKSCYHALAQACDAKIASRESATPANWGVSLSATNVTPTGLTVVFTQSGGSDAAELTTGSYYVIQKRSGQGWEDVETLIPKSELAWTAEAIIIFKNESRPLETNWEWLYGALPAGEYRIGKEVGKSYGPGDYQIRMIYAPFTIE